MAHIERIVVAAALMGWFASPALAQHAEINVMRAGASTPVATAVTAPPGVGTFIPQTAANGRLDGTVMSGTAPVATVYDFNTPLTGATVTASTNSVGGVVNPAGTIAALTYKLPASPVDGQIYKVGFTQVVTAVTWQDAGGTVANVVGGPTAGSVGLSVEFVFHGADSKWYPI